MFKQPGKLIGLLLSLALCSLLNAAETNALKGKMVLVIDDIGYNLARGKRAAELPGSITYAIIPHTPLAKKMALYTINQGGQKEIIVHMPMQAKSSQAQEKITLTESLSRDDFVATLRSGLSNVPFAVGLSNHMGSALTRMQQPMDWLMAELQLHGYFFLDSRTTSSAAARSAAQKLSVPYLKRDFFLDHEISQTAITKAFEQAKQHAYQHGMVVVVAHPHSETLVFLEQNLPKLTSSGIELITASEAVKSSLNQQDKFSTVAVASY